MCDRYEKYIAEKEKKDHAKGPDPFIDAYSDLLEKINELSLVCPDHSANLHLRNFRNVAHLLVWE